MRRRVVLVAGWLALAAALAGCATTQSSSTAEAPAVPAPMEEEVPLEEMPLEEATPPAEEMPQEELSEETASQQNARESAESYLAFSAFSRKGLIRQLVFEGYSKADARYAVDVVDANWNQQAALKAQEYLDTGAFSRQGLIRQLRFEGFTQAQAEYGVDQVGLGAATPSDGDGSDEVPSGQSVSQQNARESARSYLDFAAFSREGLINQLVFEGYSEADAEYGVDALNVNWNKQAARKAREYLEFSSFSRQGLIDQLRFEGFTQAQAEYGVDKVGL